MGSKMSAHRAEGSKHSHSPTEAAIQVCRSEELLQERRQADRTTEAAITVRQISVGEAGESIEDNQIRTFLADLPNDIKIHVAQFIQPLLLIKSESWIGGYSDGDKPKKFQLSSIPIVFPGVHSVGVSLNWSDQGWGNRKGQIYIVGISESDQTEVATPNDGTIYQNQPSDDRFGGGRLVYESPIAEHKFQPLSFTFRTRPNETYHLWAKAGGGGGHELRIENVLVHMLVQTNCNLSHFWRIPTEPPIAKGTIRQRAICRHVQPCYILRPEM